MTASVRGGRQEGCMVNTWWVRNIELKLSLGVWVSNIVRIESD